MLGIDSRPYEMYNYTRKFRCHCNTKILLCQERNSSMEESDTALAALRELIIQALSQCKDDDLLDLIYKMLITMA